VKTESTEETSYSESYSNSFDSGISEFWETDSDTTTDLDTGTESETDSDSSSKVSRIKQRGRRERVERSKYHLHTDERHEHEKQMKVAHNEACRHLRDGRLEESKTKFKEILQRLISEYGKNNRRVGAALHNLGIVNLRIGNMDDAVDIIEDAVKIRKLSLGAHHPKVSDSLVELGIVLLSQREFDDSIEIFNEAFLLEKDRSERLKKEELMRGKSSNKWRRSTTILGVLIMNTVTFKQQNKYIKKHWNFKPIFLRRRITRLQNQKWYLCHQLYVILGK